MGPDTPQRAAGENRDHLGPSLRALVAALVAPVELTLDAAAESLSARYTAEELQRFVQIRQPDASRGP